tara:strand:- start:2142 stop:2276 length:135 start_codon:yes stop_codon:yes gene_type:complete
MNSATKEKVSLLQASGASVLIEEQFALFAMIASSHLTKDKKYEN